MDKPHIDWTILEQYRELDEPSQPSLMTELTHFFEAAYELRMERLREATISEELDVLKKEAHALKNSCANVGALRMFEYCSQLEQITDIDREKPEIEDLLDALADEHEIVHKALHETSFN